MRILLLAALSTLAHLGPAHAETVPPMPHIEGAESEDDLRQDLATTVKALLDLERNEPDASNRTLDRHIGELLESIGTVASEKEAVALILEVLGEYEPKSIPMFEAREERKNQRDTANRLEALRAALELFMSQASRYPTTEEGLLVLVAPNDDGEPLIEPYAVRDCWGRLIEYRGLDDHTFELRSAGLDGKLATGDDLIVDENGPVGGATNEDMAGVDAHSSRQARIKSICTLKADEELDAPVLDPEDLNAIYRVHVGEQWGLGFEGKTLALFDSMSPPLVSPDGGTILFTFEKDGSHHLMQSDGPFPIGEPVANGSLFVENSNVFCLAAHDGSGGYTWFVGSDYWLASTAPGGLMPGAGVPVLDSSRRCLAVRAERDGDWYVHDMGRTSAPADWVSQPKLLPGGGAVTYRTWTRKGTSLFVDGDLLATHDWIRNPILTEDRDHIAYVFNDGGEPNSRFEVQREIDSGNGYLWRNKSDAAYTGGTYHVSVDGVAGPGFAFIKDPIISESGAAAYAAQLESGRWVVVHGERTSSDWEGVSNLTFDLSGTVIAYVVEHGSGPFVMLEDIAFDDFEFADALVAGENGVFAFKAKAARKKWNLVRVGGEVGEDVLGPFDWTASFGFLNDGESLWASVGKQGRYGMLIGDHVTHWFDQVSAPLSLDQDVVYVGKNGGDTHLVVGEEVGPAFNKIRGVRLLANGQVVYVGDGLRSTSRHEGGSEIEGNDLSYVVIDGELGPASICDIGITYSPDLRRAAYRMQTEDGRISVVEINGPTRTASAGSDYRPVFDLSSRLVITDASPEGKQFIIDDVEWVRFDQIRLFVRSEGAPFTYVGESGGKGSLIVDGVHGPVFDEIGDPVLGPNDKALAYRMKNGDAWFLVVNEWISEPYDEVFDPVFSDDGDRVRCIVRNGREVIGIELETTNLGR